MLFALLIFFSSGPARAESAQELTRESRNALDSLLRTVPLAKKLNSEAVAVLVFPSITKAGLLVGGQYGEGVLWKNGESDAYYSTAGVSYGLQIGAQQYGYALFFMKESALDVLSKADGFEVGVGPSVVVLDQGAAISKSTTTMNDDIYAFVFGQRGLMAGVGIQGSKITRIQK